MVDADADIAAPAADVTVEVEGIVEVPDVATQQVDVVAQAQAQDIAVAQAQADAGAQLALTGASEIWKLFVMLAMTLMAAGVLLMRWGRVI